MKWLVELSLKYGVDHWFCLRQDIKRWVLLNNHSWLRNKLWKKCLALCTTIAWPKRHLTNSIYLKNISYSFCMLLLILLFWPLLHPTAYLCFYRTQRLLCNSSELLNSLCLVTKQIISNKVELIRIFSFDRNLIWCQESNQSLTNREFILKFLFTCLPIFDTFINLYWLHSHMVSAWLIW